MTCLNRPHFFNSCRYQSSTFSCAVDCFLEVADSIFMPYLKNIPKTNIVQLVFDSCSLYDNIIYQETLSTEASHFLHDIREPLWSYLRTQCQSLLPMDCNAQFSEIFQLKNWGTMNDYEKNLFVSTYRFETECQKCEVKLSSDTKILVQYVTLSDTQTTIENGNDWPHYITLTNSSTGKLHCPACDILSIVPHASLLSTAEILFVEFASDAINKLEFYENIQIIDADYQLEGLVRCKSNHFTCAIYQSDQWYYFDDLCDSLLAFCNLRELYMKYPDNWFFAIYTSNHPHSMKSVLSTNTFAKNMFSDAFSHSEGNSYCFSKNHHTSDYNCSTTQSFLKTNLSTGSTDLSGNKQIKDKDAKLSGRLNINCGKKLQSNCILKKEHFQNSQLPTKGEFSNKNKGESQYHENSVNGNLRRKLHILSQNPNKKKDFTVKK